MSETTLTTLPFSEEEVFDIISSEETHIYTISVKASLTNLGDSLFLYISNVDIPTKLDFIDCTYEEKANVLLQWLNLTKVYSSPELTDALYQLLMLKTGAHIVSRSPFSEEEAKRFAAEHPEFIERLHTFITSCLLFPVYEMSKLGYVELKKDDYEVIDDPAYIPSNVAQLFGLPQLMFYYATVDEKDAKYLVQQFEYPVFNSAHLTKYFYVKDNILAGFCEYITGGIDLDNKQQGIPDSADHQESAAQSTVLP